MGKKDFTSFHHVKCTELGEHTLNKFYHNLLSFIFRTVEILSLGFFPQYHKEESENSYKLGCGYCQKKKFGRPASLEVEHRMVYPSSSLMALCQIQLTTLLFFFYVLTSTPYLNQQSNYAYGQQRGKNNDLFKRQLQNLSQCFHSLRTETVFEQQWMPISPSLRDLLVYAKQ